MLEGNEEYIYTIDAAVIIQVSRNTAYGYSSIELFCFDQYSYSYIIQIKSRGDTIPFCGR
jgi:hypothetical protein